jgi:osmotically-inducible protein OsmY
MRIWTAAAVLAAAMAVVPGYSYSQTKDSPKTGTEVDNTRTNKADRSNTGQTPQGQSGTEADRKLAAAVRKAIVGDKSLSSYAHNVKVVTHDGVVTLRGPVRSEDEKSKVAQLAQKVSGVSKVDNQLLVKSGKKS